MNAVMEPAHHCLRARLMLVVVLSLSFLVGSLAAPVRATTTIERDLARYHSNSRASRGLVRLTLNEALSDKARQHSRAMVSRARIFHTANLAYTYRSWSFTYLGENVGVGPSMLELHKAFMNSPGHRANILKRQYRKVGIGAVTVGRRIWVTVIFMG